MIEGKNSNSVLVIDDSMTNIKIVASILSENGFNVLTASTGKQGISLAESKKPDLILLDIMMPEMDGFAVCEVLKKIDATKEIPIIFLTAATRSEDIVKGFEMGAIDFVTKPFNLYELMARVKTHVELNNSRQLIRDQKTKLDLALTGSHIGVWEWDISGRRLEVTDLFLAMTGCTKDDFGNSYIDVLKLVHEDDKSKVRSSIETVLSGDTDFIDIEFRMICALGPVNWILSKGRVVRREKDGSPSLMIGTHIDVTPIRQSEEKIRLLSTALQQSANSIIITDNNAKIIFVNNHFVKTSGYNQEEVIGKNPKIIKSGEHPSEYYKRMWDTLSTGQEWRGEFHNKRKNGDLYWEQTTISSIKDEAGRILNYVAIQEDVTEKKKMEAELHYFSTTDSLTNAYNRRTGLEILKRQLMLSKRQNQKLTLCFIDLNGLKYVNDTFGHSTGDSYITLVADSIKSAIRSSDTIVRHGGDEFLVIMPDCTNEKANSIMIRVNDILYMNNSTGMYNFKASISYGFSEYDPAVDRDIDDMIAEADNQMYKKKQEMKQARK